MRSFRRSEETVNKKPGVPSHKQDRQTLDRPLNPLTQQVWVAALGRYGPPALANPGNAEASVVPSRLAGQKVHRDILDSRSRMWEHDQTGRAGWTVG